MNVFVFRFIIVSGSSMYPTLKDGQAIFCTQLFEPNDIKAGDIVVFDEEGYQLVKRVAKIENGIAYSENDIVYSENGSPLTVSTEEDELVVLGDNSAHSRDSRQFGPIKRSSVKYVYKGFKVSKYVIYAIIGIYIILFVVITDCFERKYKQEKPKSN